MNDELVARLRDYGDLTDSEVHSTRIEAADEIERLTAEVERLNRAAALSELAAGDAVLIDLPGGEQ